MKGPGDGESNHKSQIKNPFWPREVEMRNPKTLVGPSPVEGPHGGEMRRRIADCRERLRRKRAARRITERASPRIEDMTATVPEPAPRAFAFETGGEKP